MSKDEKAKTLKLSRETIEGDKPILKKKLAEMKKEKVKSAYDIMNEFKDEFNGANKKQWISVEDHQKELDELRTFNESLVKRGQAHIEREKVLNKRLEQARQLIQDFKDSITPDTFISEDDFGDRNIEAYYQEEVDTFIEKLEKVLGEEIRPEVIKLLDKSGLSYEVVSMNQLEITITGELDEQYESVPLEELHNMISTDFQKILTILKYWDITGVKKT